MIGYRKRNFAERRPAEFREREDPGTTDMIAGKRIAGLTAALLLGCGAAAAAEATGDYAVDLAAVYGGYQRMLALKEACDIALPDARPANGKAFAAWQAQHKALIQELQRRVTQMIRLASTDEKDFARNLGKYEGAILQERQEYRDMLLGLAGEDLRNQCQRLPETLKGAGADMAKAYAAQLEVIRKRK
jgi:hypothetical protein